MAFRGFYLGLGFGGPFFTGVDGYLQARVQCQLLQDAMHMALHCVDGEVKPLRDLLIAQAVPNQIYDLPLALTYPHIVQSDLPFLTESSTIWEKSNSRNGDGKAFVPWATALITP